MTDLKQVRKHLDSADTDCTRAVTILSALSVADLGALDKQGKELVTVEVVHELAQMARTAILEGKQEIQEALADLLSPDPNKGKTS